MVRSAGHLFDDRNAGRVLHRFLHPGPSSVADAGRRPRRGYHRRRPAQREARHADNAGSPRCRRCFDSVARQRIPACHVDEFTTEYPMAPPRWSTPGWPTLFEQQFSVDTCRAFKPAPTVYRQVYEELERRPGRCMMVAAHVWDTIGAQSAGFSGALLTPARQRRRCPTRTCRSPTSWPPICASWRPTSQTVLARRLPSSRQSRRSSEVHDVHRRSDDNESPTSSSTRRLARSPWCVTATA